MAIRRWEHLREIERWEPLQEMASLRREMDRLFAQLTPSGNGDFSAIAFMPSAEIAETDNEIHLKLEIPGLEAKDLEVQVEIVSMSFQRDRSDLGGRSSIKRFCS